MKTLWPLCPMHACAWCTTATGCPNVGLGSLNRFNYPSGLHENWLAYNFFVCLAPYSDSEMDARNCVGWVWSMAVDSPVKNQKVVTQEKEIMCVNWCKSLPVIFHGAINKLWEKTWPLTLQIFASSRDETVDPVHYHIYSINEFWSVNKYLVYKGMKTSNKLLAKSSNKENSFSFQWREGK